MVLTSYRQTVVSLELVQGTRLPSSGSKKYNRQKLVLDSDGGHVKSASNVTLGMTEFVGLS
jgi:hypothetical protein